MNATSQVILASIPSPSQGVWELGPLPLRGYALCIVLGIVAAVWIGEKRWIKRGGEPGAVLDVAVWAVIFGIIGARAYHVMTDWELYFGDRAEALGNTWVDAFKVWNGGLGIWGGIALGAVGVWLGCRSKGIRVVPMLDLLAPGVLIAQAIGRWGNWFNQELFGGPTDLPWGLEIDPAHGAAVGYPEGGTFHPTFLYECLWNLAGFVLIIWLVKHYRIGHGRVVALYVMVYTAGRGWIEAMRIDNVQMNDVLGLRLNVWTSIILFVLALAYFVYATLKYAGVPEESLYLPGREPEAAQPEADQPNADQSAEGARATAVQAEADPSKGSGSSAAE